MFGPLLRDAGFETCVHDNPRAEFGATLIGTRVEDPAWPTVVRAMAER